MHRLPTMSIERPMPLSDELEESGLISDDSALSHMKLGTAWVCATLAGVAAVAYASFSQSSSTTTMLGLAVLLAAYAGYGYFLPNKNTLQFADSLYYMSFLWAVFALIATFVIWPAPKLTADAVVTTFGYALVATFCGMLLRQAILQFHDAPSDRFVHAQDTIDRRMAALAQEIHDATTEIAAFRDRAASDLGGTLDDVVQSLRHVREQMGEQQRTMAKAMSEGFESSLSEILSRLARIHIPQELLSAEVEKLMGTLGRQEEQFRKAADTLEKRLMQAAESVTAFGESLYGSEGAQHVGIAVHDLSSKIKARTEQFAEMSTALEQSRRELDGQLSSVQSLRSAASMVTTRLAAFEAELKDLSSASMSDEVRQGLMNVQQAIRSSLEGSKAIESMMRDVLLYMKERVTEEHASERK
jgi:hypothetical protein